MQDGHFGNKSTLPKFFSHYIEAYSILRNNNQPVKSLSIPVMRVSVNSLRSPEWRVCYLATIILKKHR